MDIEFELDPVLSQDTNDQQLSEVRGNTIGECLYYPTEPFPYLKTVIFNEEDGYLSC